MNRPQEKEDWQDLILKTAREVEEIRVEIKAINRFINDENGRTEEGGPDYRKQIQSLRVALEALSDPYKRRMDTKAITTRIDNGIRIELAKHGIGNGTPEHPDKADSVGNGLEDGRPATPLQLGLDATSPNLGGE